MPNRSATWWRRRAGSIWSVEIEKSGLAIILEQLGRTPDGEALADRYARFVADVPLWLGRSDRFFVHGAFHPAMRRQPAREADRACPVTRRKARLS